MTRQARNGYQKHPKAAWGFALLLALIAAAVLIPFASGSGGSRPPTYALTGNSSACAGASSANFDVVLKNTSPTPQNLGSADLYAPQNISLAMGSTGLDGGGSTAQVATYAQAPSNLPNENSPRSLISLRNLTLPSGSFVTLHVTASVMGTGTSSWYSIAKQANSFNPGDLDTSNTFTLQPAGSYPTFTVSTCTLNFVQQPPAFPDAWQKATKASHPVSVALETSDGTPVSSPGLKPSLAATPDPTSSYFDFGTSASPPDPTYDSKSFVWTWPDAMPTATAPSSSYNLVASATGYSPVTSDQFQVADIACASGETCTGESNPDPNAKGTGIVTLTDPLAGPIVLNFGPPDPPGANTCYPWNRAYYYTDSSTNPVYFPSEELNYNWGSKMLQVSFYVRNSEWVQTNVSRGNQDADFCVGAKHQVLTALNDGNHPFVGKYANGVTYHNGYYWGVLATVANPSKVKTDGSGSPAICQRGTTYLNTGPDGASELWRFWTACIPYDWDYASKGP